MIQTLFYRRHRSFLRLWLAQLISQFGDRIHQLALVGLIYERYPGSAFSLAKLMVCTILPVFILQPFAGVFVDRWDRRTTLFVCDIARGVLVLTIPFIFIFNQSMIPIYIVVFLAFCFPRFYVPAKMSIIPDLVSSKYLLQANSLITTTGMIATILGAAIGAFIIEWYGARNGFIIDAMTFFLSAALVFNMNIPGKLKKGPQRIIKQGKELVGNMRKSIWREVKDGFQYILRHKEIRLVINMFFVLFGAVGAIYVLLIVFIQEAFQSVTRDLGVLAICLVAGLFLGVLIYGRWGKRFSWYKTIFFCLIAGGAMLAVFALTVMEYPNLAVAMGLAVMWGLTIGPIFVACTTVVHILSTENMRGQVFSALEIVMHLGFIIMMFLSSWLSKFIDPALILTAVGAICAGVGIFGFLNLSKFKGLASATEKMA